VRRSIRILLAVATAGTLFVGAHTARAWSTDAATNTPVAVVTGQQELGTALADSGGIFVTWADKRSGDFDIYAQRLDKNGTAMWPANGVVVASATRDQRYPVLATDGAGGIIVAWEDKRDSGGSKFDVYAQRINGSGSALWAANGVLVKGDTNDSKAPKIISDGSGGAIIFWDEGGTSVYAQRLDANGSLLWTAAGVAVAETTGEQFSPNPVADGSGGAFVLFGDNRGTTGDDLYAQHVKADGTAYWTANGVPVVAVTGTQDGDRIALDATGGVMVLWRDDRNSATSGKDIYTQRLDSTGAAVLASGGVPLVTATGDQAPFGMVRTGDGYFLAGWNDGRSGYNRVYAQKFDAAGTALWAANGVAASTDAAFTQDGDALVNDAGSGAILAFTDNRSGAKDVYLQHFSSGGAHLWGAAGLAAATAANDQASIQLAADGTGGAAAVFHDARADTSNDLYAQNVSYRGAVGSLAAPGVVVAAGQGGGPLVVTYDANGNKLNSFFAFDSKFRGGVNVLAADLNGDGISEIVAAPLSNGREFRVFTPGGTKLASVRLLDKKFKGGFTLSSGDLDTDGIADLVVAPATAGEPRVFALHFKGTGFSRIASFLAYAKSMRNGLDTAVGDLDGDGKNEIVVIARGPSRAHVRSFRANGALYKQFFAYPKTYRGGGTLAVADVNGDNYGDILLAPRGPARSQVKAFTAGGTSIRNYAVLGQTQFGTRVSAGDVTGDGVTDVVVGFTSNNAATLQVANLAGTFAAAFANYIAPTKQAVQATGDITGDGVHDIVTVPGKGASVKLMVFDGSGAELWSKSPFASGFKGGATVSTLVYQPS
jgi:hypothetical protein